MRLPSTGTEIAGLELEKLLHRAIAHQKLLQMMERRGHPREIVEALVAAGSDREYFARQGKARTLAGNADDRRRGRSPFSATRSTTATRLHVEDRSNGYPRQHTDRRRLRQRPRNIGRSWRTGGTFRLMRGRHRRGGSPRRLTSDGRGNEDGRPLRPTARRSAAEPSDEATQLAAEPPDRDRAARARPDRARFDCSRSTSSSSTFSWPASGASPSTATRAWAR